MIFLCVFSWGFASGLQMHNHALGLIFWNNICHFAFQKSYVGPSVGLVVAVSIIFVMIMLYTHLFMNNFGNLIHVCPQASNTKIIWKQGNCDIASQN